MFRHYRSTILQIAFKISKLCIFHILCSTTKTPDIYSSTLQLQWKINHSILIITEVITKIILNRYLAAADRFEWR